MKLLSLHYTNIGPFQDKTVIIKPENGSYIIKAPIGSGKSVLFFDGPVFAFYKKSVRPLLNILSQKGEVVVEFEQQGMQYCIQRNLSKTKTGESVKSLLRQKPFDTNSINNSEDGDIITIGDVVAFEISQDYQRVEFKNEGDLQKILDDLLPRKEVLLGTYFLMQDSINIFELPPQERLMILKNIFDLLGIDEIKEKISEQKREISAIVKVRSDTTQYDAKLQDSLQKILSMWTSIAALIERYSHEKLGSDRPSFVDEQKLLDGKVLIENFSLPKLFDFSKLEDTISQRQEEYQRVKTLQEISLSNLYQGQKNLVEIEKRKKDLTEEIVKNEQGLNAIQQKDYSLLQKNLDSLQIQQDSLRTEQEALNYRKNILSVNFHDENAKAIGTSLSETISIFQAHQTIQSFIGLGREYKQRLQSLQEKTTSLRSQYEGITQQILQSDKNLSEFRKISEEQSLFYCDKIETNCPYVDMINTSISKKNKQQEENFLIQHTLLIQQQTSLAGQLSDSKNLETLKNIQQDIAILGTLLQTLNWKEIEQKLTQWNDLDSQIKGVQREIMLAQGQIQQLAEQKDKLLVMKTEQVHLIQKQQEAVEQEITFKQEYNAIQNQFSTLLTPFQTQSDKSSLQQFVQIVTALEGVLKEYKNNLVMIKGLKIKEKMLGELYTIFSKELLLLVIQTNLPKIQDLMNAYLAQVVDYQLSMAIDTKSVNSDALELIVKIHDQHGERHVESLSGGQKVILKLVWMIAISFVTNAPMLFLDETINNIDNDTVAKVADMITNFIKTKGPDFQFYVITHSEQIQDMGIWDGMIELAKQENGENGGR